LQRTAARLFFPEDSMPAPHLRRASAASAAFVSAVAIAGAPGTAVSPQPHTSIVFTRIQYDADAIARNSALLLADGGGAVRTLTPTVEGVHDTGASWSPRGTRVVFERRDTNARNRDTLFVADRQGNVRRLVPGTGPYRTPAWGPQDRIAFVSVRGDQQCLSVVDADGHHRRDLFCPAAPAEMMRPVWSTDGSRLFVATGYYSGRIDIVWHAQAWQVDAATGVARKLVEGDMEEARTLAFSPDGTRGIYSDSYPTEMTLVDFRSGNISTLGVGCFPRWSPDGSRIAYTGEVYEGAPDFRYYEPLFVMDADGSDARRITTARVDNHIYAPVDWSRDGTRVLANRIVFTDPSVTHRTTSLRIVDVDTGEVTRMPAGYAEPGAWFEP
jgi:Tol biopolymer transport system component